MLKKSFSVLVDDELEITVYYAQMHPPLIQFLAVPMYIHIKVGKWVPFCCTLGGGVDLRLGITYEELCITFSSILIGPKKFYRHFKKKFLGKLKISFLKKSQNILKIKSRKENDNLNNWLNLEFILQIFEEKFMENLVPNFQNLVIKEKFFTIFQPQSYLQIFAILTYFKNLKFQLSINSSKNVEIL
ncbi:hypothetical protein AGLY_013943 [Aphis glycines]|uniref:Uncharacterized protein n=1 Tax=Aphis glycines TaxID=307491 RepID=A0A6G0T4M4_APHGL|nr:hypothetical protein AGLY_013943 [Aphis glycines]